MILADIKNLLFSIIIILTVPLPALAQDSNIPEIPVDSSHVQIRTVDANTLQNITDEQVFQYNESAQNPESFISRLQRWLIQLIEYIMANRWVSVAVKFIFFATFAIVLIALINQILGGNMSVTFSKKKAGQSFSLNIGASELSETNYDELLTKALAENRYRDAVRILYLKALQQLNKNGLIAWKPDKTNHDYLRELGNHPSKTPFTRLTSYYEYVEYGDFEIEDKGFQSVTDIYQKFQNLADQT